MDLSQAIYHRTSLFSLSGNLLAALDPSFQVQSQGCEGQVSAGPHMGCAALPQAHLGIQRLLAPLHPHPAGLEQAWKCGLLLLNTLPINQPFASHMFLISCI